MPNEIKPPVADAPSTKRGNELIFEQAYLQSRVIHTVDDKWDIEFAILDGTSISVTEESEMVAKAIYAGLDVAYKEGVRKLQAEMLEALTSISNEARQADAESEPFGVNHISGT